MFALLLDLVILDLESSYSGVSNPNYLYAYLLFIL